MQEQNLEEWKKIDRSTRADYRAGYSFFPGLCSRCWRAEKPDIRRREKNLVNITGDLPELLRQLRSAGDCTVGTYGWNKYGTDDAQPKGCSFRNRNCRQYAGYRKKKNKSVRLLWQKVTRIAHMQRYSINSQKSWQKADG